MVKQQTIPASQPEILRQLYQDHAHFLQAFAVLDHQMAQFSADGPGPDFHLLTYLVDYISDYPDSFHHPLEDRLFQHLKQKNIASADKGLIESNLEQHRKLKLHTRKVFSDITQVINGIVIPVERLQRHVKAYIEIQNEHMQLEEAQLFPLAERMLGDDDWNFLITRERNIQGKNIQSTLDRFDALLDYIIENDQSDND